jgi:hypothetical protein
MDEAGRIPLAAAVEGIRRELEEAMVAASGKSLRFAVEGVEMSFVVEAHTDESARGGVRFWVLEAGAEVSGGRSQTQTVTVRLEPRTESGEGALIGDRGRR